MAKETYRSKREVPLYDQIDGVSRASAEDFGFSVSLVSCQGPPAPSCFSCGGGCYGCYTPDKASTRGMKESSKLPGKVVSK